MNAPAELSYDITPLTAEQLAAMSAESLAVEYFHGLDCDPEIELEETKLVIAEVEKRGLSVVDLHDTLIREAEREVSEGWPTSEEELRGFDNAQLTEAYFEEADLAKDSHAMGLIKAEILRRVPTLEEFF